VVNAHASTRGLHKAVFIAAAAMDSHIAVGAALNAVVN